MSEQSDIDFITKDWSLNLDGKLRVCAICLSEIPRVEYEHHLQSIHGYETIKISPTIELSELEK